MNSLKNAERGGAEPDGVGSLLDTDLYKLTMQCAVLKFYSKTNVTYSFKNRTPDLKLSQEAFDWLEMQVGAMGNVVLTTEELNYLKKTCGYLDREGYLDFLQAFRFRPKEHLRLSFIPTGDDPTQGDLALEIRGLWVDTILYETPLLALVSKAYFKFVDRDWTYADQRQKAYSKGVKLLNAGCVFSDFGARRRRDYQTQDLVIQGLCDAAEEASQPGAALGRFDGRFSGTSNVHFAMKHDVPPVGTVAHEWFMGIAAASGDYVQATETALKYWLECYGEGTLGIALTDTFGTPDFLKTFSKPVPLPSDRMPAETWLDGEARPYADVFTGVRQDSGDPERFVDTMSKYYAEMGVEKKRIVFSDALNVEKCVRYRKAAEERNLVPSFGIGTHLTNDFKRHSDSRKSPPMNIVIKLSSVEGKPAIKLSDDMDKHAGEPETVAKVKEALGYADQHWNGANENSRWGDQK